MAHRRFMVFLNAQGYWVAREKLGFIEGVFPTQREAIRFALVSAKRGRGSGVRGVGRRRRDVGSRMRRLIKISRRRRPTA